MAGGKGTRLWPESTQSHPKQYMSLVGGSSLLAQTLSRFDDLLSNDQRYIVTTRDQANLAQDCSKDLIKSSNFIFEPSGRNTAPCVLLSLAEIEHKGGCDDDVIAVMPSDHIILNTRAFQDTFSSSVRLCRETSTITTIGITPNFPHTGYGYIKKGESVGEGSKVLEFVEKPNFETATKYLASGDYLWNGGMFMATLKTFKEEFEAHSPEMFSFYKELKEAIGNEDKITEIYNKIPKDSIDYAIMEKSSRVTTVPSTFDWNDLGSWEALEQVVQSTGDNTVLEGCEAFTRDSSGNIIYAPDKFVSLINVKDMIVVSNKKVTMVMPKSDSQRVREIVEHLKETGQTDLL
jgi:mannose-1-phosphate guanylyltransferase